jgi:hypothetical protein
VSASSRYRIIPEDVELFQYKVQIQRAFREANESRKFDYCGYFKKSLEDNPAVSLSIAVKPIFV